MPHSSCQSLLANIHAEKDDTEYYGVVVDQQPCPACKSTAPNIAASYSFHLAVFTAIVSMCELELSRTILRAQKPEHRPSPDTQSLIWLSCMATVVTCVSLSLFASVYTVSPSHTVAVRRAALGILNGGVAFMLARAVV